MRKISELSPIVKIRQHLFGAPNCSSSQNWRIKSPMKGPNSIGKNPEYSYNRKAPFTGAFVWLPQRISHVLYKYISKTLPQLASSWGIHQLPQFLILGCLLILLKYFKNQYHRYHGEKGKPHRIGIAPHYNAYKLHPSTWYEWHPPQKGRKEGKVKKEQQVKEQNFWLSGEHA